MPYYDFRCENNHKFELKQSYSEPPMATCPTCEAPAKRLISLVPVHYKGSGFYVTDYARKEPAGGGGESKEKESSGAAPATAEASKAEGSKKDVTKETAKKESPTKESSKKETAAAESPKAKSAPSAKGSEG